MRLFHSISGKLLIVFVMILPILVWQLGKDTVQSFRSYGDMKVLDRQNTAANTLIAGVYEILLERLGTNNALLAEQLAGSDVLSAIEKNRSVAVAKIAAAYADLSVQEFPNKEALLGDLKAAIDKANSYRAKADTAMKQGKAGRDADTVKNLFVSLSDLSAISQKVWGAVLSNTSQYDPELGRLSNLRMLAWNLRDIAGIERSHIAAAIPSKSAIPPEKLTAIGENRAQIALMWKFLQAGLLENEHPAITKASNSPRMVISPGSSRLPTRCAKRRRRGRPIRWRNSSGSTPRRRSSLHCSRSCMARAPRARPIRRRRKERRCNR